MTSETKPEEPETPEWVGELNHLVQSHLNAVDADGIWLESLTVFDLEEDCWTITICPGVVLINEKAVRPSVELCINNIFDIFDEMPDARMFSHPIAGVGIAGIFHGHAVAVMVMIEAPEDSPPTARMKPDGTVEEIVPS